MNTPIRVVKEENGTIELARKCPFCGKEHSIIVDSQAYFNGAEKYNAGELIQRAFPSFTPDQREFLMTGICSKCWDNM